MKLKSRSFFSIIVIAFVIAGCAPSQLAPTQSAPTNWEYKVESICTVAETEVFSGPMTSFYNYPNTCIAADKIEQHLNALGLEGWELVTIHSPLSGYGSGYPYSDAIITGAPYDMGRLVLKRPTK